MTEKPQKKKPLRSGEMWMAFSAAGYPVPFIGSAVMRKVLVSRYEEVYRHSLKAAGYRVARVRVSPIKKVSKRP